mmetsp:Transcript_11192/g.25929  ORF Transcript_11192/g.25929 Transcript_11192/m.25929 type:complete len:157 (+) Transcript_11192:1-471(+)
MEALQEMNHPATVFPPRERSPWKNTYQWAWREVHRTQLHEGEMEALHWYFNFTPLAGGRGLETLVRAEFSRGYMFLPNGQFPPLPYTLETDEENNKQYVRIANFPPHVVSRIADDGEWLIANSNVTFVSCDYMGTLLYRGRSFQSHPLRSRVEDSR